MISEELLAIMACPDCHGGLEEVADPSALVCTECGLHYPIKDGIPVMMAEEAYRPE